MSNKYPQEFRERVIAAMESGMKKADAAREFGVSETSIKNWLVDKYGLEEYKKRFTIPVVSYPEELKIELVRDYRANGTNVKELAEKYGVTRGAASDWIHHFKTPEDIEQARLARERRAEQRRIEEEQRKRELEEKRRRQQEEEERRLIEEARHRAWLAERQEKIDADPMLSLMQELVQEVQKLNAQLESMETSIWGVAAEVEKQSKWQWKAHKDLREDMEENARTIAKAIPDFMSVEMC